MVSVFRIEQILMKNDILKIVFIHLLYYSFTSVQAQSSEIYYQKVFADINSMLSENNMPLDFTKVVYLTENAWLDDGLNQETFDYFIKLYASVCKSTIESGDIIYTEKDKDVAMAQCAVFTFMTDSLPIIINNKITFISPFSYNYEDFAGQKDWSNMFVSTLMQTKRGNCHSLPYLYKMIMDELGYESHLALAPNHIYIKANNKKVGWYNIELTCGDFPTDAWYAASGYIHTDAIRNGIYMRALSDKEAVAMTLVDLAQGYQAKFGIEDGSFILKCCDTALEHFPKYINAMLLKAEILTELYRESNDQELFSQMSELYANIHELGYRKMPEQMYQNWLNTLNAEESNQGIKAILNPRTN